MKKSELKKIISEIVRRKLNDKKSNYGYIMTPQSGDDPKDPRLQLIGYGNMPKSYWIKKILKDLDTLKKYAEEENWDACAHLVEKNGVLYSTLNMMKDIYGNYLEEIATTQTSTEDNSNKPTTPEEKRLQSAIKNQERITAERNRIDQKKAGITSREQNAKIALMRDETRIAKKLGKATKDVLDAQKRLDAQSKKVNTSLNESK